MFDLKYLLGGEEVPESKPQAVDSITKGDCLYFNAGYVDNGYGSITRALIAGIADQTQDNSGGSAGDVDLLVSVSPLAVYKVGTADSMTQAYVGYNAALASATTVTSAAHGTDITGVIKIRKMVSSSSILCSLNYGGTADT